MGMRHCMEEVPCWESSSLHEAFASFAVRNEVETAAPHPIPRREALTRRGVTRRDAGPRIEFGTRFPRPSSPSARQGVGESFDVRRAPSRPPGQSGRRPRDARLSYRINRDFLGCVYRPRCLAASPSGDSYSPSSSVAAPCPTPLAAGVNATRRVRAPGRPRPRGVAAGAGASRRGEARRLLWPQPDTAANSARRSSRVEPKRGPPELNADGDLL